MPTDVAPYAGPIVVTVAYTLLYYAFQFRVLGARIRLRREYKAKGEVFDRYFSQDRHMLAADRVQLNMLEHMPMFVALLWLNAVFIGPTSAAIAGGIYVLSRALYPIMLGKRLGKGLRGSILFVTTPGYLVLIYFMARLLVAALL